VATILKIFMGISWPNSCKNSTWSRSSDIESWRIFIL